MIWIRMSILVLEERSTLCGLGSRYHFAHGNWEDYAKQGNFGCLIDPERSFLFWAIVEFWG